MRRQSLAATARLAVGLRKKSPPIQRAGCAGRQWMEPLEGRVLLSAASSLAAAPGTAKVSPAVVARADLGPNTAEISGWVYYDSNGDGQWDNSESTTPYWLLYLDTNNNGLHDAGETEVRGDQNGRYVFDNLAPGHYTVRLEYAPGWNPTDNAAGWSATLTAGEAVDADFGVYQGPLSAQKGSISGQYFYDGDGDGIDSGPNDRPSPYWLAYIDSNNNGVHDANEPEVRGDANGYYKFTGLAEGTYTIRSEHAPGWTQTDPENNGAQIVSLPPGENIGNINFGMIQGTPPAQKGVIYGYIFNDSNADGKFDNNEQFLGNWLIYLDSNNNGVHDAGETEVSSNAQGEFSFIGLAPGNYTVRAQRPAGWTQTLPANDAAWNITLSAGQMPTLVSFGETQNSPAGPLGSISGSYFYDSNGNGHPDRGEAASPYWLVYLDSNNNGVHDANETEVRADVNGFFIFNSLPAGNYILRSEHAAGWLQTGPAHNAAYFLSLAAGQNLIEQFGVVRTTPPTATASISGQFYYDANRNGGWNRDTEPTSPYWLVYIDANNNGVHDPGETEVRGDANGRYTFSGLLPGNYIIHSEPAEGWTQTDPVYIGAQTVCVGDGQAVTGINFGVVRGPAQYFQTAQINGSFFDDVDGDGFRDNSDSSFVSPNPLPSGWYVYLDANNNGMYDAGEVKIAPDPGNGGFELEKLAPGTYTLRAVASSGWRQTTPPDGKPIVFTLVAGQVINVEFGEQLITWNS